MIAFPAVCLSFWFVLFLENRVVVEPVDVRLAAEFRSEPLLPGTTLQLIRTDVWDSVFFINRGEHDGSFALIANDKIPPVYSIVECNAAGFAARIKDKGLRTLFLCRMGAVENEQQEIMQALQQSPACRPLIEYGLQSQAPVAWKRELLGRLEGSRWSSRLPVLQALLSVSEKDFSAAKSQFELAAASGKLTWGESAVYGISLYETGSFQQAAGVFQKLVDEMEIRFHIRPSPSEDFLLPLSPARLTVIPSQYVMQERVLVDASIGLARCAFRSRDAPEKIRTLYQRAIGVCQASRVLRALADAELELLWVDALNGRPGDTEQRLDRIFDLRPGQTRSWLDPAPAIMKIGVQFGAGERDIAVASLKERLKVGSEYKRGIEALLDEISKGQKPSVYPWRTASRWRSARSVLQRFPLLEVP